MWFLLVLATLLFGCPAPSQFIEKRPGLSCDRATKVAYRTMEALGKRVAESAGRWREQPLAQAA